MGYVKEDCSTTGAGIGRGCWSVPPIKKTNSLPTPPSTGPVQPRHRDVSFVMLQGLIYDIRVTPGSEYILQNLCENEDDRLDYSFHGDAEGTWMQLTTGSMIKINKPIYLMNRTNYKGIMVGVIDIVGSVYDPANPGPIVPPQFP